MLRALHLAPTLLHHPLLAAAEASAEITHKLFPYGPKGDPDDGQEYLRILEFRWAMAVVARCSYASTQQAYCPARRAQLNPSTQLAKPAWRALLRMASRT
jgi:hypothetical protein